MNIARYNKEVSDLNHIVTAQMSDLEKIVHIDNEIIGHDSRKDFIKYLDFYIFLSNKKMLIKGRILW